MKNFIIGLVTGLLGVLLWVLSSFVAGVGEGLGAEPLPILHTLMTVGFVVMITGPAIFWVVLPVIKVMRGR